MREAPDVILFQMEQIQLGRRCAQKAFGKIRFGTSKPGKNRFPDIDDNTVVQGGTDKDGSVERVGPGQDQIPPLQLFAAAFRIIVHIAVQEQVDFTAVMVVEKQGFRDMVFGIFQFADDITIQDAQDFPVDFIHDGGSPCNGGSFWGIYETLFHECSFILQ